MCYKLINGAHCQWNFVVILEPWEIWSWKRCKHHLIASLATVPKIYGAVHLFLMHRQDLKCNRYFSFSPCINTTKVDKELCNISYNKKCLFFYLSDSSPPLSCNNHSKHSLITGKIHFQRASDEDKLSASLRKQVAVAVAHRSLWRGEVRRKQLHRDLDAGTQRRCCCF